MPSMWSGRKGQLRGALHAPRSRKSRGACLNSPYRLTVEDLFMADRTLVKLQVWNGVGLPFEFLGPISPDLLYSVAAAGRRM